MSTAAGVTSTTRSTFNSIEEKVNRQKDCVVLQVRISSTRLPGKLLLPLKGMSIFEHILLRLKEVRGSDGIIVATTADTEPLIRKTAGAHGAEVLVGSEDDVLSRYVQAVNIYGLRSVIRATGDNPLVDIEYAQKALSLHKKEHPDLTTFPALPYGTGIEVIRGTTLLRVGARAKDPFEREHITQYIYRHEDSFFVLRADPDPPLARPDVRLTVDTEEDYRKMSEIYENLYNGTPIKLTDVLVFLDNKGN
jgi:spore coat polysaccharide biosynthesis protein SpsF